MSSEFFLFVAYDNYKMVFHTLTSYFHQKMFHNLKDYLIMKSTLGLSNTWIPMHRSDNIPCSGLFATYTHLLIHIFGVFH